MPLIDVHSAATAGIVNTLIAKEATRTAILLIIELRKVELLRGELQVCGSVFYCTRVAPSTTVVAPAEPRLSGGRLTTGPEHSQAAPMLRRPILGSSS